MSIAVARAFPTRAEARPVKSTEKIVVAHKKRGWRFLSAREARDEHLTHRLDHGTYLDSVVAYFQHEETRRAFAHVARRPELTKRSSFLKWVRELMRAEEEAERRAIEEEIRREENDRLWHPFRNASEASIDE
jgi:hypothetical protein